MSRSLEFCFEPQTALDSDLFRIAILEKVGILPSENIIVRKTKQTIDARNKQVLVRGEVEIFDNERPTSLVSFQKGYADVSHKPQAIVVGAGPAGLFAALRLIELGIKPIVLERGKDVQTRRRDLADINQKHVVNPESNYCFGEGGAGTYSDGKLYTRSKKRGDVRRILEILTIHGAPEDILVEAHPHIGTNRLPQVVATLRKSILEAGGEVHFNTKVTDFIVSNRQIRGVIANQKELIGIGVILATGHSARDIFELCQHRNILIEAKPFALGVRIEHPQSFVDNCQYHRADRGLLPAASYNLAAQTRIKGIERGVFSFCMCPGGFIVPSATAMGELVVNGMSPSRRDSHFANSGVVVAINPPDWKAFNTYGSLAALAFQQSVEQQASKLVGGLQTAPAQLLGDFQHGKLSKELLETSYQPGLLSIDMRDVLPSFVWESLKDGLQQFNLKIKGYTTNHAQMIGIESRTSSPVRIPRNKETLEHIEIQRLFPCGEGAGYAGGIVSAAMDGERCAEQLVRLYV